MPAWVEPFFDRRDGDVQQVTIDTTVENATVPVTVLSSPLSDDNDVEHCLIVLFKSAAVKKFLQALYRAATLKPESSVEVTRVREVKLSDSEAHSVFSGDANKRYVDECKKNNSSIGINIQGSECAALIHAAVAGLGDTAVYVSVDSPTGATEISAWAQTTQVTTS